MVKRLIDALNNTQQDYMFTGALAASYYGTPRTTMDIDIILAISEPDTNILVQALTEAGLNAEDRLFKQAKSSGYNIISLHDAQTPYTVDLILLQGPLDKKPCTILEKPTYIQTPENLILAKLRMIKATQDPEKSAKDKNDIIAILRYTQVDKAKILREAENEKTIHILQTITVP
ncbi:MAG: nucleotidyl transferase AbiEii/AbiGii toxin family protein [Candidatus Bathyarchaeota archaeon]